MVSTDRDQRWRSCSSFGLFREGEETSDRINYGKSRRFQLSFVVVALALLIVTGVFVVLQVTRSTKETIAKSKRFVRYEETESNSRKPQTDVDIIPESKTHPNHRYPSRQHQSRDQIMERMMKNIYSEWSPEGEPKTRNNIRDIIRRIETRKEKLRKKDEAKNSSRGMGKPILFKGVYVKEGMTEGVPEDDSDVEYFKEINEMLQGKKSEEKSVRSYRGSPFQLKNQVDGSDEMTGKASEEVRRGSKKPITVMLDIYPIIKPDGEVSESGGRKSFYSDSIPDFAYAIRPAKGGVRSGTPKSPRMIMKLNLFPKNHRDGREIDESPDLLNRRTFGWFKKKEDGHVCQLVGHNPRWKPVTAEWMDEHGDWIKANYLTLKYWDRKFT